MVRSGRIWGDVRAAPDPDFEPAGRGTWADPGCGRGSGFDGEDCVQPNQSMRPAEGPGTTLIQGCIGVLAPEGSGLAKRIRLLAQIESGIRAMQLARRRSLLDVSFADLRLRSRGAAVAARRRAQFVESARLAQVRRDTLASSPAERSPRSRRPVGLAGRSAEGAAAPIWTRPGGSPRSDWGFATSARVLLLGGCGP